VCSPSSWESNNDESKKLGIWACKQFNLICMQLMKMRAL
jgi:hypothetical protein